ncbi:MAG: hypothetical protein UR60_C0018G0015 [Candidatus Moranbacteria bacterium GW2011_GWF2_34_56]|nr:MAG: hypothetical protein UR60_C0018G0015 [Candidatus Moranbacteria bacterium GW2011_GWF2_34_56]
MLIQGSVVFFLYYALMTKQEVIINEFSHPDFFKTVLIIGIAFLFSFVHGKFTHNFWDVLGFEASKKYQK